MLIRGWISLITCAAVVGVSAPVHAQVVPGAGTKLEGVGDDFEDENWSYTYNLPKASTNIDKVDRLPAGASSNMRWFESTYRGTPDFVKRVPTPPGGLPGSNGAMALQTLNSGIPGQRSYKFQQDDLIANVASAVGYLPVSRSPSFVTRVYLPEFDQWEERTGSHFGFRIDCQTMIEKPITARGFWRRAGFGKQMEPYWPGFFIQFNRKEDLKTDKDTATILIRSGSRGEDLTGPTITKGGCWWTLGMSVTPDGSVHYYAHEGVDKLTRKDHLYSGRPYGYSALQVNTFFFNVVNQDDGHTWSTRFIVDDTEVYVLQ
jgi:hypothetical protein